MSAGSASCLSWTAPAQMWPNGGGCAVPQATGALVPGQAHARVPGVCVHQTSGYRVGIVAVVVAGAVQLGARAEEYVPVGVRLPLGGLEVGLEAVQHLVGTVHE